MQKRKAAAAATVVTSSSNTYEEDEGGGEKSFKLTDTEQQKIRDNKLKQDHKWDDTYVFPKPSFTEYFRSPDNWGDMTILHTHSSHRRECTLQIATLSKIRDEIYDEKAKVEVQLQTEKKALYNKILPHVRKLQQNNFDLSVIPVSSYTDSVFVLKDRMLETISDLQQIQQRIEDITNEVEVSKKQRQAHHGVVCTTIDNQTLKRRVEMTKELSTSVIAQKLIKNEKYVKQLVKDLAKSHALQSSDETKVAYATIKGGFSAMNKISSPDDEFVKILRDMFPSEGKAGGVPQTQTPIKEEEMQEIEEKIKIAI